MITKPTKFKEESKVLSVRVPLSKFNYYKDLLTKLILKNETSEPKEGIIN